MARTKTSGVAGAETRFKPGQSGNPGGRPRKSLVVQLFEKLANDPKEAEILAQQHWTQAKGGSVPHLNLILDRVEGKPQESVDLNLSGLEDVAQVLNKARTRARNANRRIN